MVNDAMQVALKNHLMLPIFLEEGKSNKIYMEDQIRHQGKIPKATDCAESSSKGKEPAENLRFKKSTLPRDKKSQHLIKNLPFFEEVLNESLPKNFWNVSMAKYNGASDLFEHLFKFRHQVPLHQNSDGFKCQVFLTT